MSELKACPFCNVNEWKYQSHFSGTTIYQCEKCGTIVEEWVINIRPIEDALQAENERLKEELQQEKTRSQLNLEAEERRMLNITYYCAEIDRLNARIAELEGIVKADNLRLINAGLSAGLYSGCDTAEMMAEEILASRARIAECESALISMVQQFFYNKDDEDVFRHAFMSAEEEAAIYLVEHGIARWADKRKSSIYFNEAHE